MIELTKQVTIVWSKTEFEITAERAIKSLGNFSRVCHQELGCSLEKVISTNTKFDYDLSCSYCSHKKATYRKVGQRK